MSHEASWFEFIKLDENLLLHHKYCSRKCLCARGNEFKIDEEKIVFKIPDIVAKS